MLRQFDGREAPSLSQISGDGARQRGVEAVSQRDRIKWGGANARDPLVRPANSPGGDGDQAAIDEVEALAAVR